MLLVFGASLLAVAFRLDPRMWPTLMENSGQISGVLLFAVPGVIVGGQLGPRVAEKLPRRYLRLYVGALLAAVAILVGVRTW